MTREIKFRAWFEKRNKWVYFHIGQTFDTISTIIYGHICLNGGRFYEYTGLKDKNGKEIYEGDIVAFPKSGYDDEVFIDRIYWSKRAGGWNINSILAPTSEVIGNIYENPELLEK